jgi:hypothetical protein|nr:MAG TPA: hypothetical protein [Caudoviricetes sp.]
MTTFVISANVEGKDERLEFAVPQNVTTDEWKQMAALFKMAMEQLGRSKKI